MFKKFLKMNAGDFSLYAAITGGLFLLGDATAPAIIRLPLNLLLPLGQSGDVHLYSAKELKQLLSDVFHAVESRRVSATSLLAWGISA